MLALGIAELLALEHFQVPNQALARVAWSNNVIHIA